METTIRTTNIYQKLDLLYHSLTSVLPDITSPLASCYMLKTILAEISYIYNEIYTLKERWRTLLPFDEDDAPEVQWKQWSDNLQPKNVEKFIKKYRTFVFAYVDLNEGDEAIIGKKAQLYDELYHKLDKLSVVLRQIHFIVRGALPESILKLYDFLQKRSEQECMSWQNDLSKMSSHTLKDHEKHFRNLVLENFIKIDNKNPDSPDYMKTSQQKWEEMTDKDGIPYPIVAGRYIYENRFHSNAMGLDYYFEYVRILEFIRTAHQEEQENKRRKGNSTEMNFSLPKKGTENHEDILSIFNHSVDIEVIKGVIQGNFIPLIKPKNRWVCVWRLLMDKKIFRRGSKIDQFADLMSAWFPNDFSKDDLHVYRHTHFATKKRKEWNEKSYKADIKTHRKASPRVFEKFAQFYDELKDVFEKKHLGKIKEEK